MGERSGGEEWWRGVPVVDGRDDQVILGLGHLAVLQRVLLWGVEGERGSVSGCERVKGVKGG